MKTTAAPTTPAKARAEQTIAAKADRVLDLEEAISKARDDRDQAMVAYVEEHGGTFYRAAQLAGMTRGSVTFIMRSRGVAPRGKGAPTNGDRG